MVFVIGQDRKPLNPCHPAWARILLKTGKAAVWRVAPFTIILKTETDNVAVSDSRLKIDYGSRHTGLAILQENKAVWLGVIDHRTNIKKGLDDRRAHRRFRRGRLRYRKPRFLNRRRPEGWLPPSLQSRVDNIAAVARKLSGVCRITAISYENVKFDAQLLMNPEISGVEYQQGELRGYEVREYLLEKFGRKCCYCHAENLPLEIEHIVPRSRHGSDRVSNLAIACHECNLRKGNRTAAEFGHPEVQAQARQPLRDAAMVTATRWAVYNRLKETGLPVECGSGALTKMNRIQAGLPKEHYYDACSVGASTPGRLHIAATFVQRIIAKGRGTHSRTNLDKYGFPRGYLSRKKEFFGFQTGDTVRAVVPNGKKKGVWSGRVLCRGTGSFDIKTMKGRVQGVSYKYCRLVQSNDGYQYFTDAKTPLSSP